MSPGDQSGRVPLSLSPAEEMRHPKALEQKEQMLASDLHMATALLLHKVSEWSWRSVEGSSAYRRPSGERRGLQGQWLPPLTLGEVDALNSGC